MTPPRKSLNVAIGKLNQHAADAKLTLHPSFVVELENYARHDGVKDLPAHDFEVVIEKLGARAMERALSAEREVRGGDVRTTIIDLCNDPFSDCSLAAVRVLEDAGRKEAARDLGASMRQRYGV